jgi:RHS repeat-associated protein
LARAHQRSVHRSREFSYYRARWYDPQARRFLSEDPIGLNGGINLYSYVSNNPLNLIDPNGTEETTVCASVNGGERSCTTTYYPDEPKRGFVGRIFHGIGNWFSATAQGIKRNANFFHNWLFELDGFAPGRTSIRAIRENRNGNVREFLYYGYLDPETKDMQKSAGMYYVRNVYKNQNNCQGPKQNIAFPTWMAALSTTGDPSSTAFQVGGFTADIEDMGAAMRVTLYNNASWTSLLGMNVGLDHERVQNWPNHGYGGNVRQMFEWIEMKPCGQ